MEGSANEKLFGFTSKREKRKGFRRDFGGRKKTRVKGTT